MAFKARPVNVFRCVGALWARAGRNITFGWRERQGPTGPGTDFGVERRSEVVQPGVHYLLVVAGGSGEGWRPFAGLPAPQA